MAKAQEVEQDNDGNEGTYPYAYVAWVRKLAHYAGQDCGECPGAERCYAVYAARCQHAHKGVDVSQEVFPCGLSPEKGTTAEEVLRSLGESHSRGTTGQHCAQCGKSIRGRHRLCYACRKRREHERAKAGDAAQAETGS